ncbi:hypothetical protein D3C80_2045050 [compost metagenome]
MLNVAIVPAITTNEALGTPAIPLLVSININNIVICCSNDRWMPYDCAMNNEAKVIYIIEPSRLKE